ncbi:MAG: 30S ribosomal protein S6 [Candidatus Onthovivens sp.]|nr:30S ribosomal protein S6 [Mollicutes bacterium]MDY4857886.1 30S ribosomal protein S6 [Candidatus Onthovivens sp.]MDY4937469.1 30S ribosomal protein S6 [Candidatus Onthovivens sp.]
MKKYEIMYILKANLEDAQRKEVIEKLHSLLTNEGAKVTNVNEWGLRDLAYPIKKETKGYYVVIKVECEPNATKEFDRKTKINNNVLRYLITVDQE